jgi:hypothetical protein
MLKKFTYWLPLFAIFSIAFDLMLGWGDPDYRWMAIMALIGWLFYWDTLNDLREAEAEIDELSRGTDVKG